MLRDLNFQKNKVSRFIQQYGETFVFKRPKLNDFGEPINDGFEEITIKGVYHETNSYVSQTITEGTVTRTKKQPMILCFVSEAEKLKYGDALEYKQNKYNVVSALNLAQLDICCDISLEVVQDARIQV